MAGVWEKSSLIRALILLAIAKGALSLGLPCKTEGQNCSALVSFVPKENTNVSAITSLFQLSSYQLLLGANAWNFSLGANTGVPKGTIVKVPITCSCFNSTGISKDGPKYKVQPDNTLSIIANTIFGGLMTYFDIQKVNSQITDVNKILAGDTFRIPLPCSCSPSTSSNVIHYSYVVQKGNSLNGIASQAGTTESTLMALNNISNPTLLQMGEILDVPLKACSSNFSTKATDRNLLVANGSYAFTASNCLQCSCGPSDLDLYCVKSNLSATCSGSTCKNSNLMVGSMSTANTSAGCKVTKCSYNGYTNKIILTHLETSIQPQCPANHVLPTLTTPSHIVTAPAPAPAPAPGTESPVPAQAPGTESPSGAEPPASPFSGAGPPDSPPSGVSGPSKSMAADSLSSLPLATTLVLGLVILNHFGEW